MAAGSIVIDLLMKTASFTTDTARAEKQLQKLKKEAVETGKELGLAVAGIAASATGAIVALNAIADKIGAYQDLADVIGDTASSVAALQLAADQSGTALDTIASASVKLTTALSKTDDEAKGVGAALGFLGIGLEDFRKLKPVEQLEAVAQALANVEDKASATAVATTLFGKSGAQLIPFFNDLVENGGRTVRLTEEQIKAADQYGRQVATLRSELGTLGQVLAVEVFPAMNDFLRLLNEALGQNLGRVVGGIKGAFADLLAELRPLAQGFNELGLRAAAAGASIAALRGGNFAGAYELGKGLAGDIASANRQFDGYIERLREASRLGGVLTGARNNATTDPRSLAFGQTPQARTFTAFAPASAGRVGSGAPKMDEAQRYLDNLQKQLERTKDLTAVETVLADIEKGRIALSKDVTRERLLAVAEQIDQAKLLQDQYKAEQEQERWFTQAMEDRKNAAKSLYEQTRTPAERLNSETARLNDLLQDGAITWDTYSRAVFAAQDAFDAAMAKTEQTGEALDQFAIKGRENIQQALGDGLFDALSGNFDNIGQAFKRTLLRMAADAVAADLASAIFGNSKAGGGGLLGSIGGAVLKFFGGGRAGGGDVLPDRSYLVGESGPERFVPRTAGRIVPMAAAGSRGGSGGDMSVTVVNGGTPKTVTSERQVSDGQWMLMLQDAENRAVARAVSDVRAQIRSPNGGVRRDMQSQFRLQRA